MSRRGGGGKKHRSRKRKIAKRARNLSYLARWHTKRAAGNVTAELVDHLIDFQEHRCWYCHGRLNKATGSRRNWALEHQTPISRGGTNEATNLVIACRLCNKLKNTQTAEEFLARVDRPGAGSAFPVGITQGGEPTRGAPSRVGEEPTGEGSRRDRLQAEPRDLGYQAGHPSARSRRHCAEGRAPESSMSRQSEAELPASAVSRAREHRI